MCESIGKHKKKIIFNNGCVKIERVNLTRQQINNMQLLHKRFISHQQQLAKLVFVCDAPKSDMKLIDNTNDSDRERPRCVR